MEVAGVWEVGVPEVVVVDPWAVVFGKRRPGNERQSLTGWKPRRIRIGSPFAANNDSRHKERIQPTFGSPPLGL